MLSLFIKISVIHKAPAATGGSERGLRPWVVCVSPFLHRHGLVFRALALVVEAYEHILIGAFMFFYFNNTDTQENES